VLFEYGTGPIKGFAVSLAIGLVGTVFQAVVINRLLFEIYPGTRPVATLSI
jgi:preprotein translocase subunit SecD